MLSTSEEGGLKEARYAENNIIISYSTLCSILPPQLKKMYARYRVMCDCKCCISSKIIHSSLLSWSDHCLKNIKYLSQNYQKRRYGEMADCLLETYKNSLILHGLHIYVIASNMEMATMCAYPPSKHA